MDEQNTYYNLGKRDAVAEILLLIRTHGLEETARNMAEQLLAVDKEHPHAKWVLQNITPPHKV